MTQKNRTTETCRILVVTALILVTSFGVAAAQSATAPPPPPPAAQNVYVQSAVVPWPDAYGVSVDERQVPQDIRIMQRIVTTALQEVDPPELPPELKAEGGAAGGTGYAYTTTGEGVVHYATGVGGSSRRAAPYIAGSRDVTGFYMQGYGYLFTVKWRVSGASGNTLFVGGEPFRTLEYRVEELARQLESSRQARARADDTTRAAAQEAEKLLEQAQQKTEAEVKAMETWAASYRQKLSDALRNTVAAYGSTLRRAAPTESITVIADFGGGADQEVTMTVRRQELQGADVAANTRAVRVSRGAAVASEQLRTQLAIMAEIIDTSLSTEQTSQLLIESTLTAWNLYTGGDAATQYVPGYGVIFRKNARLGSTIAMADVVGVPRPSSSGGGGQGTVQRLREQMEEDADSRRQRYQEHLAGLKQRTAEILATYGPTLTEMKDEEWVGIYYNVGSSAGVLMLDSGVDNYLVQARMRDIRQSVQQADGAAWLLERLVTNEKQD